MVRVRVMVILCVQVVQSS